MLCFDWNGETIAFARNGNDVHLFAGMFAEHPTQHEHVLHQVSIACGGAGPDPVKKHLLFDDVTTAFEQEKKNLKDLFG
ncbi:MAG: hypothetical protein WA431_07665 [Candidatus Cybelea sp.]